MALKQDQVFNNAKNKTKHGNPLKQFLPTFKSSVQIAICTNSTYKETRKIYKSINIV